MRASAAFCKALLPDDPRWAFEDAAAPSLPAPPQTFHDAPPSNGWSSAPQLEGADQSPELAASPNVSGPDHVSPGQRPARQPSYVNNQELKFKRTVAGAHEASRTAFASDPIPATTVAPAGSRPAERRASGSSTGPAFGGWLGDLGRNSSVRLQTESFRNLPTSRRSVDAAPPMWHSSSLESVPSPHRGSLASTTAPPTFLLEAADPMALAGVGLSDTFHIHEFEPVSGAFPV